MDPKECLRLALAAAISGDYEAAAEHVDDYNGWRSRGGFEPTVELSGDDAESVLRLILALRKRG